MATVHRHLDVTCVTAADTLCVFFGLWFFLWESTFCIVIWLDMEILNLEKLINGYKAVEVTF